jgi:hypothetical protein
MNPSDLELVAVVAGIVAAARKQFVKIDGLSVYVLAAIASVVVCYIAAPGPLQPILMRAARIVVGAVGGVSLTGYFMQKLGAAMPGTTNVANDNAAAPPGPSMATQPSAFLTGGDGGAK